jgi:hypothetical protein
MNGLFAHTKQLSRFFDGVGELDFSLLRSEHILVAMGGRMFYFANTIHE